MDGSTKKWVSVGVVILFVIIGFGLLIFRSVTLSQMGSKYASDAQTIAELKKNIGLMQAEITDAPDVSEVRVTLSSAASAGTTIANLQMQYSQINDEMTSGRELFIANSNNISAFLTDSGQAVPWYFVKTSTVPYQWVFASTYSFRGDTVPVLWTCKTIESNELLAYATGIYNAKTNKFEDVSYHTTTVGSSYIDGPANSEGY